ncbi:hypothetical protein BT67DRAFT_414774 [Trichocladium antarcticum]|uniref:Sin3-associated polypeptide Sap18 n=1 Tax=Trichocladium antarcticum TaxID=1450529 RepID=A0AAN6ZGE3_9PEZI|nr:hypothetical protein BT67DRAFT_414774 [Trichocladium antarcticum]
MSASQPSRAETAPFLVKLFYRTGAFHRTDEFNTPSLPPHLPIHTWRDCTLTELSHYMVEASPPILPDPAIGTRLAFRLIYADTRAAPRMDLPPRFVTKDLGSIVLGEDGPGADDDAAATAAVAASAGNENSNSSGGGDAGTTLADARFMTGDYISCAILPPNELTGEVAPASSARIGRGAGVGEAKGGVGPGPTAPPPTRQMDPYGGPPPFRGRGVRGGHGAGGGYWGGARYPERDEGFGRGGVRMPEGEWRRGDRLPDDEPPESGRWGR